MASDLSLRKTGQACLNSLHPDVGSSLDMVSLEDRIDGSEIILGKFDFEGPHVRLHLGGGAGAHKRHAQDRVGQHPG